MLSAAGFITVLIASAFLDGSSWAGAAIACAIGAALMWAPLIGRRIRRAAR